MKTNTNSGRLLAGLTLAALGAWATASAQKTAPQGERERPQPDRVEEQARNVRIQVTGLTVEKEAALRRMLLGIGETWFECSMCSFGKTSAGTCSECEEELTDRSVTTIAKVQTHVADGFLTLGLRSGGTLRLSQVERVLGTTGLGLRKDRIVPGDWSKLIVRTDLSSEELEEVLEEEDLFEDFTVQGGTGERELAILVERGGAHARDFATLSRVLADADPDLRVADVAWIGPCARCAAAKHERAGCKACWTPVRN